MDALKSYLSLIDPQLLNHVTGKPRRFVQLFKEQEYISEQAFISRICGKKYNEAYYRSLKSSTIKILQSLAVVSTPKGDSLVKKKYEICQKNFLIGQKLLAKKNRKEGLRLLKKAYEIAVDYNFVSLVCETATILYHNQVYFRKNAKKAAFYRTQIKRYLKDYMAEKMAECHFYEAVEHITRSSSSEIIWKTIEQIEELKGTSIKYQIYRATLIAHYGFHIGAYKMVINSCTTALKYFKDKNGVYISHYHSLFKNQGVAQMALGQYMNASESFEQSIQYVNNRSYNQYIVRFYQTLNALHAQQYQLAYQRYKENQKCRFEMIRQQFAIIEAYLHFLVYMGHLSLDKPFRLGKYLNDTFKAQADKRGDNINILIAELLVYLAKDRGKFIDRIEAVKNYSYRYLKGEDTQRAKWMIRILCLLPRANFNAIALQRLAKKQIALLQKSSLRMGENFAIEIIPFEHLLHLILTKLDQPKRKRRG